MTHRPRSIPRIVLMLSTLGAVAALASACSSQPADEDEDVASLREAICGGGGGGNDPCVNSTGWCPPECGTCFTSFSQKIELQNMWECLPDDPGGGGGGNCGPTWQHIIADTSPDRSTAEANLRAEAQRSCATRQGCRYNGQHLDEIGCRRIIDVWECDGRLRCDYR